MSTRDLDLALRIKAAVDGAGSVRQLANEVNELGGESSEAAGKAEELNGELASLGRTDALVQGVRNAERAVNDQAKSLDDLKQKSMAAEAQGRLLESNVAAVRATMSQASDAALELGSSVQRTALEVKESEAKLAGLRAETDRGVKASDDYKAAVAAARAELQQRREALSQQQTALRDLVATETSLERSLKADEAALASNRAESQQLTTATRSAQAALDAKQKALQSATLSARAAGVETSDLASEERRLQLETTRARIAIDDLRSGLQQQKDELAQTATRTRQLSDEQRKAKETADALGGGLTSVARGVLAFAGVQLGSQLVRSLVDQADAVRNVESRLRLATGSTEELAIAQRELLRISNESRTAYTSTADLYSRIAKSTRDLNLSQQQQLEITRAISQSLAISGSSTQAQEAALVQLGQALQNNVLRGDEFNSVMEQAPRLAQALADGLGVPISQLRSMAEAGELSAERVTTALRSQSAVIAAEFGRIDPTINGVIVKIKNNFAQTIAEIDKANGVSDKAISALTLVADNMSELVNLTTLAGEVALSALAVKGVKAAYDYGAGLVAAQGNALALAAAVRTIALPLALAAVLEYADDLGELAAKWTGLDDAARSAAEARRTQVQAEIDQLTGVVEQYLRYAQVRIKSAQELSALNDEERAAYAQQLQARLSLEEAEIRRAVRMAELGTATQAQVAEEAAGYREVRDALDQLGSVQVGLLGEISVRARQLSKDFDEVAEKIDKASEEALAKLAARAASDLPEATRLAQEVGREFVAAGALGGDTALLLGERFSDANATVRQLQATLDAVRQEQMRRLGIDTDAVLTGIDSKAKGLLATFSSLAQDSSADAKLIKAAFDELLKRLDTPQELESLKLSLAEVENPAFDAAAAVGHIEARLAALPAAAGTATAKIEELFKKMGLTASSELDRIADAAKRDYAAVVAAGAPLGDQQVVFERYAKAALDAAERRGSYALQEAALQLRAQSATESQRGIVETLTKKYADLRDASGSASGTAVSGHRAAAQAAASEFDSITALTNARIRLSAEDEKRIRDLQAQNELLREQASLVNARDRINNLSDVSAAAASINGRGAVGFGADGIAALRQIQTDIARAVQTGRITADALQDTEIESPDDVQAALRQIREAQGQAAALATVTGSQAVEARNLADELQRASAALLRAVERYRDDAVNSGQATVLNPGTGLGREQTVYAPNTNVPPQTPGALPQPQPGQIVNINLSIGGGTAVPLFGSPQALQQLLQILEQAGFNATIGP